MASGVLVALILIGAVCTWLGAGDNTSDLDTRSQPNTSASASTAPKGQPGVGPTAVPTTTPDVKWELFGQIALPHSEVAGPFRRTPTTAAGFAHSPIGALLAVAHISTRAGSSAGKAAWQPTVTEQVVPSADRDLLFAGLLLEPPSPGEPGELSQLIGFRYITYAGDTAVIGLVWRAGPGVFVISTLTAVWQNDDWRLQAPPLGDWQNVSQRITELIGVVQWGAR